MLFVIRQNESGKGKRCKLSEDQTKSAHWSKGAAKFGKVPKCAVRPKSLRTTELKA